MRTWTLLLVGAAATAMSLVAVLAQPGGPGGGGEGPGGGGPASRPAMHHGDPNAPHGGFHLLPRELAEKMNLSDQQRKQVDELAKETKAKLDQILTPEQRKMLDEFRPPRPPPGPGGPGGGPGSRPAGPPPPQE